MKLVNFFLVLFIGLSWTSNVHGAPVEAAGKKRLLVVSSYHKEYSWSRETNAGLCDAMLKVGYFDNKEQIAEYSKNDFVETPRAVVRKLWLDAKRKGSKAEKEEAGNRIYQIAREFQPDLIFLGDDDAAEFVGQKFLDAEIPVIFWGLDNTPLKYGLVDSMERPGHNVTGVYQSGYYKESFDLLRQLVPKVKTFALLTDETSSGRSHKKKIEHLAQQGALPLQLVEEVSTNDFETWKMKALELQTKVDAFYVATTSAFRGASGQYVSESEVVNWFVTNIKIPEAARGRSVKLGLLCVADDSGYKQGFEAVLIAHDILDQGANPATYPPRTPSRGALIVNKKRAESLGISITADLGIEELIE